MSARALALSALLAGLCPGPGAFARPADAPPPAPAISISSRPAGALLSVDGAPRGVTPATVHLIPGRHVARLELPVANRDARDDRDDARREPATYVEFETGEAPADFFFELPAPSVTVLLSSEPAGAAATLDGADVGVTPVLLPELAPGRHVFGLSLDGYRPQTLQKELVSPAPELVSVRLVPSSATLRVSSEPAGASVSVNGIPRGAAPVDVSGIPEGEASVEVSLAGHATFRRQVRLASGDDVPLLAALEPLPATLRVVTVPAGARVYVADEFRGLSPFVLSNAVPGDYRVRVHLDGHDPLARTATLAPGALSTEEFRLRPNAGRIALSTSPALVTVTVDGKRAGSTAARAGGADAVSEELVLSVPAGSHAVELSRPGYRTVKRTVEVGRDAVATLGTVALERLFLPDVAVTTRSGTVVRGVFSGRTADFYRVETAPGLVHSIPAGDIESIAPIRSEAAPGANP